MTRLLDRSPFLGRPSAIIFHGEMIRIRADQIILWVSLTIQRLTSPNPSASPFPVILDTGHTHTFSIQEHHLINWAGLRPEAMAVVDAVSLHSITRFFSQDHDLLDVVGSVVDPVWGREVYPEKQVRHLRLGGSVWQRQAMILEACLYPAGEVALAVSVT